MESSLVSPHRGAQGLRRGRRLNSGKGTEEKQGTGSVDPALAETGCHLFTHSIEPPHSQRNIKLHNVSS